MLGKEQHEAALLVSILSYVGLRPGEALHLRWSDVDGDKLHVRGSVADGQEKETKTGVERIARLVGPVRQDLLQEQMRRGRPPGDWLMFPNFEGKVWTDGDYRNFRARAWRQAVEATGLPKETRIYDARHTCASLWIAAGRNVLQLARQMGHSPTMLLGTYGHLIDAYEDSGPIDLEAEITKARMKHGLLGDRQSSSERGA